jgi:hypothetical protein
MSYTDRTLKCVLLSQVVAILDEDPDGYASESMMDPCRVRLNANGHDSIYFAPHRFWPKEAIIDSKGECFLFCLYFHYLLILSH